MSGLNWNNPYYLFSVCLVISHYLSTQDFCLSKKQKGRGAGITCDGIGLWKAIVWYMCVFVCMRVCLWVGAGACDFVWKSLRSIFCGKTEGSGRVDYTQALMAHYLFMSPTSYGSLKLRLGSTSRFSSLCSSEFGVKATIQ